MNETSTTSTSNLDDNLVIKRQNIINNTPPGYDPVLYWHQVAMDAIHAKETRTAREKEERDELEQLRRYKDMEQARITNELSGRTIPNFRELLYRVEQGDFSMNVQLSFYPNRD